MQCARCGYASELHSGFRCATEHHRTVHLCVGCWTRRHFVRYVLLPALFFLLTLAAMVLSLIQPDYWAFAGPIVIQ